MSRSLHFSASFGLLTEKIHRHLTIHSSAGVVTAISTRFALEAIIWTPKTRKAMEATTRKLSRKRTPWLLPV
jgi:hypothetical protein